MIIIKRLIIIKGFIIIKRFESDTEVHLRFVIFTIATFYCSA